MILAGVRLVRRHGIERGSRFGNRQQSGAVHGERLAQIVGIVRGTSHLRNVGGGRIVPRFVDGEGGNGVSECGLSRIRQDGEGHQEQREDMEKARQDAAPVPATRRTNGVHAEERLVCAEGRLGMRCGASHVLKTGV